MENIALLVNLEGTKKRVTTDWRSLAATLQQRGVGECALQQLHTELRAGLIVSTRGLTLCMKAQPKPRCELGWGAINPSQMAVEQPQLANF
ncbi:hypothetical protein [Shewanella dokdonensis]|uniref:hypothetical protein n=1 Tax=Shewanella dokdonensis TaxID=712036 RepID=UPI00200EAB53|nr:hypothetical protein [Shewanella dokdonensis]MCL1074262.1 hypothetical protein [Shewanella dokdonensis]